MFPPRLLVSRRESTLTPRQAETFSGLIIHKDVFRFIVWQNKTDKVFEIVFRGQPFSIKINVLLPSCFWIYPFVWRLH